VKGTPLVKDGKTLAVVRPTDPEVAKWALAESLKLVGKPDPDGTLFNGILAEARRRCPYTFRGLLSKKGEALDPQTHEILERLQDGDSFIDLDDLANFLR